MLSSAKRGGKNRVWNEIGVLLIEVEEGIDERPSLMMSADITGSKECQQGLRSAYFIGGAPFGGWGRANETAPTYVIDECNGFGSNTIYHRGMTEFTLISILRKHNCNLLSSGILRQCTMNGCGHKR